MRLSSRLPNLYFAIFCILFAQSPVLYAEKPAVYENSFATHRHVLEKLVQITDGPIIEFGCGKGSTDFLHSVCEKTERTLITIDDSLEWLNIYREKYRGKGYTEDNSGWHKFYFVPGKKSRFNPDHWIEFFKGSDFIHSLEYSVCFIDQSPWLARYETVKRFKEKSQYVIVHDCDYFPRNEIFGTQISPPSSAEGRAGKFDFSDEFRYFKVYYPAYPWPSESGPPTLVGSMTESNLPCFDPKE